MPEWLISLLSLLAGSGLTLISGWASDRRAAARDREARAEERRDRQRVRRDDFQRETLIRLQDAAMRLARCAGAAHHQDVMVFRQTGQWQKQLLAEPANEDFRACTAELGLLASRVRDEQTRRLATELQSRCGAVVRCSDENASVRELAAMGDTLEQLHQRSGQLIRDLDELED